MAKEHRIIVLAVTILMCLSVFLPANSYAPKGDTVDFASSAIKKPVSQSIATANHPDSAFEPQTVAKPFVKSEKHLTPSTWRGEMVVWTDNIDSLMTYLAKRDYKKPVGPIYKIGELNMVFLKGDSALFEDIKTQEWASSVERYTDPLMEEQIFQQTLLKTLRKVTTNTNQNTQETQEKTLQTEAELFELSPALYHGATKVWAKGYTGKDVKIAVVDSGVDFASPDIQGTQARVTDINSPYYGWPIAFDQYSMFTYLFGGDLNSTDVWYADTRITATEVNNTLTLYHTISVDGQNDFWSFERFVYPVVRKTRWDEFIAGDAREAPDILEPNLDISNIYATSNETYWFFGFDARATDWNMRYGFFINPMNAAVEGGRNDPEGNYFEFPANRPHQVLYIYYSGVSKSIEKTNFYVWDAGTGKWLAYNFTAKGGKIAIEPGKFIEIGIPKKLVNNADKLSVLLATFGWNNIPKYIVQSPTDDTIATASTDHVIKIWNTTTQRLVHNLTGGVNIAAYSPDGKLLAAPGWWDPAKERSNLYIWYTSNGSLYTNWTVEGGEIKTLSFSPNGTWLAGGTSYKKIAIWNITTGKELTAPVGGWFNNSLDDSALPGKEPISHEGPVTAVAWSEDGSMLFSASTDKTIKAWNWSDTYNWQVNKRLKFKMLHGSEVTAMQVSPDYTKLATCSADRTIRIWDIKTGDLIGILSHPAGRNKHTDVITSIDWSSDSNMIVSGSKDCTIRVWDANSFDEIVNFTAPYPVSGVTFNRNDDRVFSICDKEVFIRTWSIVVKKEIETERFAGHWHLYTRPQDAVPTIMEAATVLPDWGDETVSYEFSSSNADPPQQFYVGGIKKSISGVYHIGYLPYDRMPSVAFTTYFPTILVVDNSTADGLPVYDTVYIDMNNDLSFADERPIQKGDEIAFYDKDGDGFADYSGGLLYWIAQNYYNPSIKKWETPIPYSDVFIERYKQYTGIPELKLKVPENGTLVCFMFDSNYFFVPPASFYSRLYLEKGGTTDGTAAASVIVGKNKTVYTSTFLQKDFKVVQGVAPDAKIIAVRRGSGLESLVFAVEGYDGIPGTGDEAQIVYYGYTVPFTQATDVVAGWDITSRFMDYLANVYSSGNTIFVTAAGDTGPGYGTINSPGGSRGILTAGSATATFSSYFVDSLGSGQGPFASYNDVAMTSSRGPTAMGRPKPDVVATGTWLFCSHPLYIQSPPNGRSANGFWYGTSAAAAVTSGLLALVYDAYKTKHGVYPTVETVVDLVKSTADDMHYDVFAQGSGFVNAYRAVNAATDEDGIVVSPTVWVPGKFRDVEYEAFARLMFTEPGRNVSQKTFKITNHNSSSVTVEVKPTIMKRFGTYSFELDLTTLPEEECWRDIRNFIPEDTELLKITAHSADEAFWNEQKKLNPQHSLWVFDGVSAEKHPVFKAGDNVDEYGNELNRDYLYHKDMYKDYLMKKNLMEVRIHNPLDRSHEALWLFVRHLTAPKVKWNITLDFYKKVEWGWISVDKTVFTIPGYGSADVTATIALPSDVPVGTYEGSLLIRDIRETQQREQLFTDIESTKFIDVGREVDTIHITLTRVTNVTYTNMSTTKITLPHKNIYPGAYEVLNATKHTVVNEFVLNATGGETYAYLQNAPVLPWGFNVKKNKTGLIYGVNYLIDFKTGNISFLQPLGVGDNITADYIWRTEYKHMVENTDYRFDLDAGVIEFTKPLIAAKDMILLNYSWASSSYRYVQFAHKNIVTYKLFKNGTGITTGYTIDYKTGVITFSPVLNPEDSLTTTYTYIKSRVAEFKHGYANYSNYPKDFSQLVPGSITLYDIDGNIVPTATYLDGNFNGRVELVDWPHDKRMSITGDYKYSYNTVVPIVVNVATRNVMTSFAGSPKYNTDVLFSSYEFFGGYGGGAGSPTSVVDSGDWRYFFIDIPDSYTPSPDKKLYVDVTWSYPDSQADIYTIGRGAVSNEPSGFRADIYGPYTLVSLASNKQRVPRGIPQKSAALEVKNGLTVVAVHNIIQNGTLQSLPGVNGTVRLLYDINPFEMDIHTNKVKGEQPVSFRSSIDWPGVGVYAKGPASPIIEMGLEIPLGGPVWPPHDAPVYVKKVIEVKDCLALDIWVYVQPDADIDICLHYDADGNGILDPEKDQPEWWSGRATGYHEHISVPPPTGFPKDGKYFLIINNFESPGPSSPVDLYITMVAGVGLSTNLPEAYPPLYFDNNTVPANTKYTFKLKWDMSANDTTIHRPGPKPYADGSYKGVMYFGPNYVPFCVYMPVTINFERGAQLPPSHADSEETTEGSKEGDHGDLQTSDDKYEILREADVGGVNKLTHKWRIPLTEIGDYKLKLEAHTISTEAADDFKFYYSINETSWEYMFTIPSTQSTDKLVEYTFEGGALMQGYVWIKVEDTNRLSTDTGPANIDSILLDYMCIETIPFGVKPQIKSVAPLSDSIVTTPTPSIVCEYNEPTGKIDIENVRISLDDVDVTAFSYISQSSVIYNVPETNPLSGGWHRVMVTISDSEGNVNWTAWSFFVDYTPPFLEVTSPAATTVYINEKTITVTGKTDPTAILYIYPHPERVRTDVAGTFSKVINLTEGVNGITIHAEDEYGNVVKEKRTIIVDTKPPSLMITKPRGAIAYTSEDEFKLEGTIKDITTGLIETGIKVTVNDKEVYVHADGNFSATIPLPVEGENVVTVVATDAVNNTNTQTCRIKKDKTPPVIEVTATVSGDIVVISGKVTDATKLEILKINGMEEVPAADGTFRCEKTLSKVGKTHKIVVEAEDIAGNVVKKELAVVRPVPLPMTAITVGVVVAVAVIIIVLVFVLTKKKPYPPAKPPEKVEKIEEKEIVEKAEEKEVVPPLPPPPAPPPTPPTMPPPSPPPPPEEEEWK